MRIKSALTYVVLLTWSILCFAMPIDRLIVFGDSLSDNGNVYWLTQQLHRSMGVIPIVPRVDVYYEGHFSNGFVWVEVLSDLLGMNTQITSDNYAYGGAMAELDNRSKLLFPPSLPVQITNYLIDNYDEVNKDNHLYVLWMGANDYLANSVKGVQLVDKTIDSIKYQLERLIANGARHFVVLNLPDLGKTPKAKEANISTLLTQLSERHNAKLANILTGLKKSHPEINLIDVDMYREFEEIFKQGPDNQYHLLYFDQPCYSGNVIADNPKRFQSDYPLSSRQSPLGLEGNPALVVASEGNIPFNICDKPDEYFFWDPVHPTARVHRLIAYKVADVLRANGIY